MGHKDHSSWPKLVTAIQAFRTPTEINQDPPTSSSSRWRQRIEFSMLVSASTATGGQHHPLPWPDLGRNFLFPLGYCSWHLNGLSSNSSQHVYKCSKAKSAGEGADHRDRAGKVIHDVRFMEVGSKIWWEIIINDKNKNQTGCNVLEMPGQVCSYVVKVLQHFCLQKCYNVQIYLHAKY